MPYGNSQPEMIGYPPFFTESGIDLEAVGSIEILYLTITVFHHFGLSV
jgi:hypothetical protein